ncbi:peptide transporter PTR3-like protein [Medicago truncatula]|uniref:Peptide transporter PTR3-like protein n=2 Tax=Medicago truncatula TaxID=3880 RepID=G7KXD4_MEDTR|nr:peptide transporter PTR3-like protein [Medicago truncatula]
MSYFGISSNLVLYLTKKLHQVEIVPVIGAYIADAYLGRYWTFVVSTGIYFLGMCLLTLAVSLPMLRPPPCSQGIEDNDCQKASSLQIGIFFFALYIIAAGTGGLKRSQKLSFFNWWVFCIITGGILAETGLVYIQDNVGLPLVMGFQPSFFVAALRKWNLNVPNDPKELHEVSIEEYNTSKGRYRINHSSSLRFLDKAAVKTDQTSPWMLCTVTQIEETKQMTKMIPILIASCIPSTIFAQTNTLFVKQGTTLDRRMGAHFKVPPASLIAFVHIFMVISIVIYDFVFVPIIRRIGVVFHVIVMVVSCLIERKRLSVAREHNLLGKLATTPLSIFILVPHFALMGIADTFVEIAKTEFFYDQAPESTKSLGTSYYSTTISMGNYLSTFLLSNVARLTSKHGHKGWILDNLNISHLDYYYAFLALISVVNFFFFLVIAKFFVYNDDVT